jgi:hypothetical protein
MASESTEGRTVSLDLPATLDEWLTERASELGVGREELVVQLLGSYQVTAEASDGEAIEAFETILDEETVDVESVVEETVAEAIEGAGPDEEAIAQRVQERVEGRIDGLETEMEEKLDDVRRRVLQIKKEADAKAPADHDHKEFARVGDLKAQVDQLRDQVTTLAAEVDETDTASREQLAGVERKLTQLARVVVRMRDEADEKEVLDSIKRKAARNGFEQADCGACSETINVALLPEATCPHCGTEFGDIVGRSGGLFGAGPRLTGRHERVRPNEGVETVGDGERGSDADSLVERSATDDGTGTDGTGGGAATEYAAPDEGSGPPADDADDADTMTEEADEARAPAEDDDND